MSSCMDNEDPAPSHMLSTLDRQSKSYLPLRIPSPTRFEQVGHYDGRVVTSIRLLRENLLRVRYGSGS